jgi:ABC transport system ATP-binding/permease protein
MRGDRIGILGNNGVGKTTLLRLLLGQLNPQSGTIKHGTNIEIGYFDQLRESLDEEKSVADNVGDGRTYIRLNGKDRHIIGYLKGFLFSPKRAMTPVKALSGGERNRIILAKLFTRAANLLILDEPTNDLDMETLEVLEAKLVEYSGTLIVVSHDRHFLDAVVTRTLVFEADGVVRAHAGGYSDWARQHRGLAAGENKAATATASARGKPKKPKEQQKLSYKLKRELEALPDQIEQLETALAELNDEISAPDFYRQDHEFTSSRLERLGSLEQKLARSMERWAELEQLANGRGD